MKYIKIAGGLSYLIVIIGWVLSVFLKIGYGNIFLILANVANVVFVIFFSKMFYRFLFSDIGGHAKYLLIAFTILSALTPFISPYGFFNINSWVAPAGIVLLTFMWCQLMAFIYLTEKESNVN